MPEKPKPTKRYTVALFNHLGSDDVADALASREADTDEECCDVAIDLLEETISLSPGDRLVVIDNRPEEG